MVVDKLVTLILTEMMAMLLLKVRRIRTLSLTLLVTLMEILGQDGTSQALQMLQKTTPLSENLLSTLVTNIGIILAEQPLIIQSGLSIAIWIGLI